MSITEHHSQPFASLQALEHASDALIAGLPEDELAPTDSDCEAAAARIELFIDRAIMTGTVLDEPDDRKAAQALVDFWLAKRFAISRTNHTKQRPSTRPNTLLRPFDRAAMAAAIAEGDKVLAWLRERDEGQSKGILRQVLSRVAPSLGDDGASYHDLARRMLLRTIPMSSSDRTCEPTAVERSDLLLLGDAQQSKEVLDALIASGVLREETTESGARVSLRYETLPEDWEALRRLIEERVNFRDTVASWQQRGSAKYALASAGQANKAQADYADVNELERVFINASLSHGRRKMFVRFAVLVVALPLLGVASKILYDRWEATKREAAAARAILTVLSTDDVKLKEESIRKLAQFGEPLNFQSLPLEHLDLKNIYGGAKSPAIVELFRSGIVSVDLAGATLPYASFSQCKIYEVKFSGAELSSARFDEAVITKTDFSGAVLYRAIFDHAQFNSTNDFSNADLRSASFRDVGINGDLKFTDTAWWLAFGWTLPQIERFAAQYSDVDIKKTKIFNDDVVRERREIDNATSPEDHVRALNALAWTYAIYGADLQLAEETSQKALDEFAKIKTMKGKSDTWIAKNDANFTDTKAYILLQEDKPEKAAELYEQPGIVDPNSQGDLIFKYAVALHALAMTKSGDEKEKLDRKAQLYLTQALKNRNYIPSHELYLLRRYITDEFKDKLVANLGSEAN